MQISDFPRPPEDNGRGVHWSARVYHPSGRDLDFWITELTAMHIKWVKLLDDGDGSSLELCRRLLDAGIMPVVRLFREQPNPDRMGGREVSGVRKLVAAGVHYFETNNEPDLPAEWKDNHKPDNWLDIVTNNFIYDADIVFGEGGLLAVPAMGPGGRDNIIRRIVDKGRADLFDRGTWLAIHNYTLNHPPDYPDDPVNQEGRPLTRQEFERFPAWAWDNRSMEMINERRARDKNPGQTLADDANCFRGWEWAGKMVHDVLGRYIPAISTEGGPVVGWGDDLRYPKVIPSQQAEWQVEIVRFMQEKAPAWYFSCCTWLLASRPLGDWSPTWDQMSWYTDAWNERFGLAGRLPVIQALKDLPPRVRAELRQGTASLTLIVQRADRNEAVAGVTVEVEATAAGDATARRFEAVTDAQGRLTLDRLPAAAYRLLVFGAEAGRVTLSTDDRKTLTLRPQMGRRSRLLGRIVDSNGAPQAGLPVILQQASPLRMLAESRTDGDGRYAFTALPAGKLRLRVAPGTSQSTERRNIAVDGWTDAIVDLTVPPPAVQHYAVTQKRLLAAAETGNDNLIFGRVLDEQGNALDGVTVRLRWTGAAPDTNFPTVKSGQDQFKPRGYFQFIHTPGVFMVDIVDPNYQSQNADNLITADMPDRPRPLAYEVTFQRKAAMTGGNQSSVRGRIVGAPSTASVTLSGAGIEPRLARLAADGSFRFADLPAGVYQLGLEGVGIISADITLDGIGSSVVEFPMLGQIVGRVLPANQPATVVLTCETYSIRQEDETDAGGEYVFAGLPADTYTLRLKESALPAQELIVDGRTLAAGPTFDRDLGADSALVGRITDHQGRAVTNAIVWLRALGQRVAEGQTDGDGRYRFDGLRAGVYSLELVSVGLIAQNLNVDGSTDVTKDVHLSAPALSSIVGKLVDADDQPLSGRTLLLSGAVTLQTVSAADGTFRFEKLGSGDYTVRLAEQPSVKATATLGVNAQAEVTLKLPAAGAKPSARFGHYLFVSTLDTGTADAQLALAVDYILRKAPTVGFNPDICAKSERVTIIGTPSDALLASLTEKKIPVTRVSGNLETLRNELEALP